MVNRKVFGVGINDWDVSCSYIDDNGKKVTIKEYLLWYSMLSRCYSSYTKKVRPTYENVTCDESWLSMKKFINDVSNIHRYDHCLEDGWVLDKDILVKGNKHYSIKTCCFVPSEINGSLTIRSLHRGDLPLGVTKNRAGKYVSRCGYDGSRLHIGVYDTVDEAFNAYVKVKKSELKRLADKYRYLISEDVYFALINREFNIDD